jgi:uncharacterized protein with von Willebrand factor type A (vWA) domain
MDMSKEDLLDEVIVILEKLKTDYSLNDLNLDVRRFRNKLLRSGLMQEWKIEETVSHLHDFLLDFQMAGEKEE